MSGRSQTVYPLHESMDLSTEREWGRGRRESQKGNFDACKVIFVLPLCYKNVLLFNTVSNRDLDIAWVLLHK